MQDSDLPSLPSAYEWREDEDGRYKDSLGPTIGVIQADVQMSYTAVLRTQPEVPPKYHDSSAASTRP